MNKIKSFIRSILDQMYPVKFKLRVSPYSLSRLHKVYIVEYKHYRILPPLWSSVGRCPYNVEYYDGLAMKIFNTKEEAIEFARKIKGIEDIKEIHEAEYEKYKIKKRQLVEQELQLLYEEPVYIIE